MNNKEDIVKEIDFSNLNKFFDSINEKKIDLQTLNKIEKNKVLIEGVINAKENNDNSIVEYLINVEKFNCKSLGFLNEKLNLKINFNKNKF